MKSPTIGLLAILALGISSPLPAWSAPTKVGNGDDGSDLEKLTPIQDGPVFQARDQAVRLLERLDIAGVENLGMLLPEVKNAQLFMAASDVAAATEADQSRFHSDLGGRIYARTFAEPHAATRFFPVALKLEESQLVALQIHEALHRALPARIRENEGAVAQITLSITAPEASRDRVRQVVAKYLPPDEVRVAEDPHPIPESARVRNPSLFAYTYRRYNQARDTVFFPVSGMHSLQSFLYPFGSDRNPLGIGIEASFITNERSSLMGPLALSARMRLWSGRGFDIGAWGTASLNTLSAEELRNSPIGRDLATLGLSMRKELAFLYFENFLSVSSSGRSTQTIGPYSYSYSYGALTQVSMHAGATILSRLKLGAYAEIGLADHYRVEGTDLEEPIDSGRIRLLSGGPEITWQEKEFAVSVTGRKILDRNQDVSYDNLGNLMGQGSGQGFVSGSLSFYF